MVVVVVVGGFKTWWRGLVKGNRCLLKPQGTSQKPSSTLPQVLSCNWWCADSPTVTHITTVCHVTSLLGVGGGRGVEISGLIFTSGLREYLSLPGSVSDTSQARGSRRFHNHTKATCIISSWLKKHTFHFCAVFGEIHEAFNQFRHYCLSYAAFRCFSTPKNPH